jgi:hypothetical protein
MDTSEEPSTVVEKPVKERGPEVGKYSLRRRQKSEKDKSDIRSVSGPVSGAKGKIAAELKQCSRPRRSL